MKINDLLDEYLTAADAKERECIEEEIIERRVELSKMHRDDVVEYLLMTRGFFMPMPEEQEGA